MRQTATPGAVVGEEGRSPPGESVFFWLATLVLAVVYLSLAWSLDAAGWAEGLHVAAWAALFSVIVGALLARVPWPAWFVQVYVLVTGVAAALYLGASLLPAPVDSPAREMELIRRIGDWGWRVVQGQTGRDNLVFVVDVVLLLWFGGAYSARHLLRHGHVWRALLLPGAVLVLNAYYAFKDVRGYVVVYLIAAVVLLAVNHLYELVREWESEHVRYPFDIGIDFLRDSVLFAVLLILIAWRLPPVASTEEVAQWITPLRQGWRQVQEEWSRLFNTLNYQAPGAGVAVPTFPESFDFRGAPNLSDTPYFRIQAPQGRYWRAAVYDYYRGTGWDATVGTWRELEPATTVAPPAWDQVELVTQTVEVLLPLATDLVAAPMPIQVDLPVSARVVQYPDPVGGGGEVLFALSRDPLPRGSTYRVVSLVANPTAQALREAPTAYPAWIRERYLQLPDTLPPRVRELAEQLTAGLDNPYDKARAIEAYLRSIPYNEDIPMPPRDRDAVDWFLFDLRQGYCDYFASAMVVMARAVGIPARFASGFARGEFDPGTNAWVVREKNAHSWPELYFPGYGWVPFEPTPSQPPLVRPENLPSQQEENARIEQLRGDRDGQERNIPEDVSALGDAALAFGPFTLPVPPVMGSLARGLPGWFWPWAMVPWLAAIGVGLARWRLRQRQALLTRPDGIVIVYTRLVRWARRLGVPLQVSQTPREQQRTLGRSWPRHRHQVQTIVSAYERMVYAPPQARALPEDRQEAVVRAWDSLWPVLVWRWPVTKLKRWKLRAGTPKKRKAVLKRG